MAQDIEFPEGSFIESDPLDGKPDSEDYSGYTGKEGVSATHFYRKTVCHPGALQPFFTKTVTRSRFSYQRHQRLAAWSSYFLP